MSRLSHVASTVCCFCLFLGGLPSCAAAAVTIAGGIIDSINFGDTASERAHALSTMRSEIITGALAQPARQLLPLDPPTWDGGKILFTLKGDPRRPNYFTLKMWGGDFGQDRGRLLLFCQGKQVGQRHLGEIDILDILSDEPRFPVRFYYKTLPLPEAMTKGKESVQLEVRALGRIWAYGDTWEGFQKVLEKPSRGIYRAYTHSEPYFGPPAGDPQGEAPANPPVRNTPGPEVLQQLKDRVNAEIKSLIDRNDQLRQVWIQFLAKAYHTPWTDAYRKTEVLDKIVKGIDFRYRVFQRNPDIVKDDRETWNYDWFGYGPTGDAIRLLDAELKPYLDGKIQGTEVPRRKGWSDMLVASRDFHATTRRQYTNQSMIKDLYGIYLCNRAVQVTAPSRAWPQAKAKRYLYESVGLEPWRGSDDASGKPTLPLGADYMQLTEAGLTKELGYVGGYGEVIDWVVATYDATRPAPGAEGDLKIKRRLVKIAQARGPFRHPNLDAAGNRTMHLETVVGWRDHHYPGGTVYDQRTSWDAGPMEAAAATMDPVLIGYARQMLEDNQYFHAIEERMKERGFRVTAGLLAAPESYEKIKTASDPGTRLPMAEGQLDFVFADPEVAVVAVKNGQEILYASLYWRARYAINHLARVHHITPTLERDATVRQETLFQDSGLRFVQPDQVNEPHSTRHEKNLPEVELATAGEEQPIARIPPGVKDFKPGKENVYAGKGDFYRLRYGPYLIAMNTTTDRTFELEVPPEVRGAKDLVSPQGNSSREALKVRPRATIVLFRQDAK